MVRCGLVNLYTYTASIIKKYGMENCKPVETPVDLSSNLVSAMEDTVNCLTKKSISQQLGVCCIYHRQHDLT
jgi:hypothetical protein